MTTKESGPFSKRQKQFVNEFSGRNKNCQFSNLNLNQNQKYLQVEVSSLVQSYNKSNNDKIFGYTVIDNYQEKGKSWNKSTKEFCSKTSKNLNLKHEIKEESRKRWMMNAKKNSLNDSTLSLHIAAYENSIENDSDSQIEDSPKKSKAFKSVHFASKFQIHQDFFEFPRQMGSNKSAKPEVQQFKASQKLLSPKQSVSPKRMKPLSMHMDVKDRKPERMIPNRRPQSQFRAQNLLIAIRPKLQKGYKTGGVCFAQICLAFFIVCIGLIEGFHAQRTISGLICFQYSIFFGLLWVLHFFGWKYNSHRLLIAHTIACALLAISSLLFVLVILFSDIYNGAIMNFPTIRHEIQVGIIEALSALPLLVIFGASSWNHAERNRNYSNQRRRFLFSMKALESYILQKVRFR